MDNFEWAAGFRERFGIVYTDFLTQKRTLKDSAYWYKDTIAANGANLEKS
jgi:beta-glucosidase